MRLTQSTLAASGDCLRKAQYTLDRPVWARRVSSSPLAVGTGFHAGLELYYGARKNNDSNGPPFWAMPTLDDCIGRGIEIFNLSMTTDLYDDAPVDDFLWDDKIPDPETAHRYIAGMLTAYWPNHWPDDWDVLAVELHGQMVDEHVGAEMKIGADLVLVDPNNWLVAVDWKTAGRKWNEGKEHPRKNVQAPFYQRLLRKMYPGHAGYRFVFDIICYPSAKTGECAFERRISDPQPEHEQAIADRAKQFVQLYQTIHVEMGLDLPTNPASTLCSNRWCSFFSGCPSGAALN